MLVVGAWCLSLACNVYDSGMLAGAAAGMSGGGGTEPRSMGGTGAMQATAGVNTGGSGGSGGTSPAPSGGEGGNGGADIDGGGVTGGGAGAVGGGGGAAGSAGATQADEFEIIDDMEDGDARIAPSHGRTGSWYVGNDGTMGATQEPPVGTFLMTPLAVEERPPSLFAAHTKVAGFKSWGSLLGLNFLDTLTKGYDASEYCGVQFWGKAAAVTALDVRLPDGNTRPEGKVCDPSVPPPAGRGCHNHFVARVTLVVGWKEFTVAFSDLRQGAVDSYRPPDGKLRRDQLFALEWHLPAASGKAQQIWIDDVAFRRCP